MKRAYIIHKGWASDRPKEFELSETSASHDPLCKAIGPHKSLSCSGLQHTQQRNPDKNSKYLRIHKKKKSITDVSSRRLLPNL